jgi:hypothetical protein
VTTLHRAPAAALGVLLAASGGCSYNYKPPSFVRAAPASTARIVTVTLDRCDCALCQISLLRPPNGAGLFSVTDPPVGDELTAIPCETELSLVAIVECGNCPGPGPCTATATVRAGGVALAPLVSCDTLPAAGASCQDRETLDIDPNIPVFDCS